MSPTFLTNPTKMCRRFNASSIPAISFNHTDISTLINIYPPTENMSVPPTSSNITIQALYHLLDFPKHQIIDREMKRSNTSGSFSSRIHHKQQRFNFAKLADQVIKDKEDISSSSLSFDTSSLSTPSSRSVPAAITSGISLLASTTHM